MNEYVWVVHGDEFAEMARKSQETVRHHEGENAQLFAYVDKAHGLEGEIVVPGYHDVPFMLMNVLCQFRHLAHFGAEDGQRVFFLDADVFMASKPPPLGEGWDLAVTWRDNMGEVSRMMPYNYGVVIAHRTVQSIASFAWMADHITKQRPEGQRWYGNQIALRELCGPTVQGDGVTPRRHAWFDLRVRHLPCAEWNWSPDQAEEVTGKVFVHLKGGRKDLVDHYVARCLA